MNWPSHTPDINPMENIWAILKRKVMIRNPQNIQELIESIHNECRNFPQNIILHTFNSYIVEFIC